VHGRPLTAAVASRAEAGLPRPPMVHGPHSSQRFADAPGGSSVNGNFTGAGATAAHQSSGDRFINRAIAPVAPTAAEPIRTRSATPSLDLNGVADQVYQLLVRRLASERLRKGL
jgi:hypothetical protein